MLALGFAGILLSADRENPWAFRLAMALIYVHSVLAVRRVYSQRLWLAALKASAVGFHYVIVLTVGAIAVVGAAVWLI